MFIVGTSFGVGRMLSQIKERQLYGEYRSFKELVRHELDCTDRAAFGYIFACNKRESLIEEKVEVLTNAEAQVRPLAQVRNRHHVEKKRPAAAAEFVGEIALTSSFLTAFFWICRFCS
jgi:hypothetical protein